MSISEYIISAFRCLSASKMRTFLTTLGIIVGISSVILINTIGGTIGKTISTSLMNITNGNIMNVYVVDKDAETSTLSDIMTVEIEFDQFTQEMVAGYEEYMQDMVSVFNQTGIGNGTVGWGRDTSNVNAFLISQNVLESSQIDLTEGRIFSEGDYNKKAFVVIVSDKLAEKQFGKESAIGKNITLENTGSYFDGREFTVVGVYKFDDMFSMGESDPVTSIYIPDVCAELFSDEKGAPDFYLQYSINEGADIEEVRTMTEEYFDEWFEDTEYRSFAYMLTDELDQINGVIGVITKIIAAIAAISLLVGGIGVMNIMLVSVSERTMEIGVRKAMGADNKSIRIQFITESIILSLIGSVIGIITGLIEAKLLALLIVNLTASSNAGITVDLSVPVSAVIVSVVFSFAVGLVFGVYPADKAAKMEVVDALRYE